jgi:hypothetical protein
MDKITNIISSTQWYSIYDLSMYQTKIDINYKNIGIHDYECQKMLYSKVKFSNCENLIINVSYRDWIFYNFSSHKFPNVKNIFIVCPPCNETIISRFPNSTIFIYSNYIFKNLPNVIEFDYIVRDFIINNMKI